MNGMVWERKSTDSVSVFGNITWKHGNRFGKTYELEKNYLNLETSLYDGYMAFHLEISVIIWKNQQ